MITRDLEGILAAWEARFTGAMETMFKGEMKDDYTGVDDGPSLAAFYADSAKAAQDFGAVDPGIVAYRTQCLNSPAKIVRVHVVGEVTPYLRWEMLVCYRDSLLKHGAERIFLVAAHELREVSLPESDFWIFDGDTNDAYVLQWTYDNDGALIGGRVWAWAVEEDRPAIRSFLHVRDQMLAAAGQELTAESPTPADILQTDLSSFLARAVK